MKKLLLALAATSALAAAAAPAMAQPWNGGGYSRYQGYGADHRLTTPYVDSLDYKITEAARQGRISWGEARSLRDQVRSVHDIAWRVQTGEARRSEVARLEAVVNRVEQAIGGRYGRSYTDRRYDDDRRYDNGRYDEGRGYGYRR